MGKIDGVSGQIISHLRKDARSSAAAIGREIGIATSTVAGRIKKLEEQVIHKHTSLLDYKMLGYPFQLFVYGKHADNTSLNDITKNIPYVNNSVVLDDKQFALELFLPSLASEEETVELLQEQGCQITDVCRVLQTIKNEEWTPGR